MNRQQSREVDLSQVLLIDDDRNNIDVARPQGVHAIHFDCAYIMHAFERISSMFP